MDVVYPILCDLKFGSFLIRISLLSIQLKDLNDMLSTIVSILGGFSWCQLVLVGFKWIPYNSLQQPPPINRRSGWIL